MGTGRPWRGRGRALQGGVVAALVCLTACTGGAERSSGSPSPSTAQASGAATSCATTQDERTAMGARMWSGLSSQFAQSSTDEFRNLRAVVVDVCGKPVLERYLSSTANETHNIASVTKSFVGTLVGIALADGSLTSLDQPLRQLLPRHAAVMTPAVAAVTLRQLLTMTAGLDADADSGDAGSWSRSTNFVDGILRQGVVGEPGQFAYSSASSHLLSAVLSQATGRSALSYATDTLFGPLGIDASRAAQPLMDISSAAAYDAARFAWPVDHQGVSFGGGWMKVTARDMVKLGQLYLDDGLWNGRQVVPSTWVRAATTSRTPTSGGFGGSGYGYQWWVTEAAGHPAFAAIGYGGQLVQVVPDLELVAVFVNEIDTVTQAAVVHGPVFQTLISTFIVPAVVNG